MSVGHRPLVIDWGQKKQLPPGDYVDGGVPHSLYEAASGKQYTVPEGHNLLVARRIRVFGRLKLKGRMKFIPRVPELQPITPPPVVTPREVEELFTVTDEIQAAKGVTLSAMPAKPSEIKFVPYEGPEQRVFVDFTVSGSTLSWAGLALELLLSIGDSFAIRYTPA